MEYGAKHLKLLDDIGVPHGMFIEALNKGGEMLDDIQTDIMLHAAQVRADSKAAGDLLSLIEEPHSSHEDGGPGSGNWGHSGRPGKRGGSAGGGGVIYRKGTKELGFSSEAKERNKAKSAAFNGAPDGSAPSSGKGRSQSQSSWNSLYCNGNQATKKYNYASYEEEAAAVAKMSKKQKAEYYCRYEMGGVMGEEYAVGYAETLAEAYSLDDINSKAFYVLEVRKGAYPLDTSVENTEVGQIKSNPQKDVSKTGVKPKTAALQNEMGFKEETKSGPVSPKEATPENPYILAESDVATTKSFVKKTFGGGERLITTSEIRDDLRNHKSEQVKNAKTYKTAQECDDELREKTGAIWRTLGKSDKEALTGYTDWDYSEINSGLRKGKTPSSKAKKVTDAISKSRLDEDVNIFRATDMNVLDSIFGRQDWSNTDLSFFEGQKYTDNGFLSCTGSVDKIKDKKVTWEIFAPKGTQALYAEPFSAYGTSGGSKWNGRSKSKTFEGEGEVELILQRGTQLKITGIERNSSTDPKRARHSFYYTVKAEILSQPEF